MIYRIPRNSHRARPLKLGLWRDRLHFRWVVKFTDSCKYDIGISDQQDVNKLCGVSFLPGGVHRDSARFGWRWNGTAMEIHTYCYVSGRRVSRFLANVELNKEYLFYLNLCKSCYYFSVDGIVGVEYTQYHTHDKKWKYRNGIYFGGNRKTPHEMKIEIRRA